MTSVIFLGTGGSTPTRDRSLPSVAVQHEGSIYLFDCGEGTQRQFINYSLSISKVECIFISHMHGDHVIGVAGLIRTLALNGRTRPLYIFVPKGEENAIKSLLTFDKVFIKYQIMIKELRSGVVMEGKDFIISAFRLNHSVLTYGFVFAQNDKLHFIKQKCTELGIKGQMFSELERKGAITVNRKRIRIESVTTKEKGKRIVYATDTRPTASTVKAAMGADLLIHESTYEEKFRNLAVERKHSTSVEAATIAKRANVKALVLFHVSARYKQTNKIVAEAKKIFKNTSMAQDGLRIEV